MFVKLFEYFVLLFRKTVSTLSLKNLQKKQKLLFLNRQIFVFYLKVASKSLSVLTQKTNVMNLWKWHFSLFCKFLSNEVETLFWNSEVKPSKLFKSNIGHRKNFRNGLETTLRWKTNVLRVQKWLFFFENLNWRSWNHFWWKQGKDFKTI